VLRKGRNRKRRTIPYAKHDWFRQYKTLAASEPYHALLESGQGGRYRVLLGSLLQALFKQKKINY
jgi:para-aminobenzoate synthetase component 1